MHVIHLRGPWECLSAAGASETLPRLQLPLTISPESLPLKNGELVLGRKFGRPTGIQPGDTIELAIRSLPLATIAQLGELNLGTWRPSNQPSDNGLDFAVEVTNLLRERNQLVLTIAVSSAEAAIVGPALLNSGPLAPWPEVCLKIYPAGAER